MTHEFIFGVQTRNGQRMSITCRPSWTYIFLILLLYLKFKKKTFLWLKLLAVEK